MEENLIHHVISFAHKTLQFFFRDSGTIVSMWDNLSLNCISLLAVVGV